MLCNVSRGVKRLPVFNLDFTQSKSFMAIIFLLRLRLASVIKKDCVFFRLKTSF